MNPFREVRRAWRESNFAEVERSAKQALSLDRTLPELHFRLGYAQLQLGKHSEAVQSLEACLGDQLPYPTGQTARMAWALARARMDPIELRGEPPIQRVDPVSVIICSITPTKFARVHANYSALLKDVPHEIIGIHDARSLSEGYNRGARRAKGETLIFSHDDVEIVSSDFARKLADRLSRFDLIGIAGTDHVIGGVWTDSGWPHVFGQVGAPTSGDTILATVFHIRGTTATPIQGLDGVFLATRRSVFEKTSFDESIFDGWHLYDLDFSYRVAAAGFKVGVCNDLLIVHHSEGTFGESSLPYIRKFMKKHFPASGEPPRGLQLPLCTIELNGADEWRMFTQYMISRSSMDNTGTLV